MNSKSNTVTKLEETDNQQESANPEVQTAFNQYVAELEARQSAYMARENPSFIFYHSFYEMIEDLEDKDFVACIKAACQYGLYNKREEYSGFVKMFMAAVIPQIDANVKRRITARLNGLKGGARENNDNACKQKSTENNLNQPKTT
jgi:hypothetical protein